MEWRREITTPTCWKKISRPHIISKTIVFKRGKGKKMNVPDFCLVLITQRTTTPHASFLGRQHAFLPLEGGGATSLFRF